MNTGFVLESSVVLVDGENDWSFEDVVLKNSEILVDVEDKGLLVDVGKGPQGIVARYFQST